MSRLTVTKALSFVNRNDQQSFRKYLTQILKTSKTGPSMEKFIAEFFQFSAKIIDSFVLSS